MAIRPEDEFLESAPADADYPEGSMKDTSTPTGTDGSPLVALWVNDFYGILQKLIQYRNITVSGVADTVQASDYFDALSQMFVFKETTLAELQARDESSDFANGSVIRLIGKSAAGDMGGGLFYWSSASTATEDEYNVVKATSEPTGRWLRLTTDSPWSLVGTGTRTSDTQFTIPKDLTALFVAGKRLQVDDGGLVYASVLSSSFGASVTTVNVAVDGVGALTASLTNVRVSAGFVENSPFFGHDHSGSADKDGPQIDTGGLATDSVTSDKIAAGQVGPTELATDAIETLKIKNLNVTNAKIADATIIGSDKLVDASITPTKILNGAPVAFYAVLLLDQTGVASGVPTKVALDDVTTLGFQTSAYFNTADNRFKPLIAGKYLISCAAQIEGINGEIRCTGWIYKNGTPYIEHSHSSGQDTVTGRGETIHIGGAVIDFDGVNDYVEMWVSHGDTGPKSINKLGTVDATNAIATYMTGHRIAFS